MGVGIKVDWPSGPLLPLHSMILVTGSPRDTGECTGHQGPVEYIVPGREGGIRAGTYSVRGIDRVSRV